MTVKNPNDWASVNRHDRFVQQSINASNRLLDDIKLWRDEAQFAADSSIKFHIGQFYTFCENAFAKLNAEASSSDADSLFRFKVTGVLTTQWSLLRVVASQRVVGGPYSTVITDLDSEAARYYTIGSEAIPQKERARYVPRSIPLVFLGQAAELVFFNDEDQLPPAIISVPFGVINDDPNSRSRLSLAHEVGHAILQRFTPFQEAVEKAFKAYAQAGTTRQDRVVRKIIAAWRQEILADAFGTTVVGPAFVDSALDVLAGPPEYVSMSDDTHPVPIIRPYIYLTLLKYIAKSLQEDKYPDRAKLLQPYIDNLEILETKIDEFAAPSLDRRFETLPALTRVTLGEVKDQLIAVTELLLEQRFDSLGQSFGEYLIECAVSAVDQPIETFKFKRDELEAWGEQLQFNEDRFVLDLSNLAPPSFSVPISFGDLLCLIFGVNCS